MSARSRQLSLRPKLLREMQSDEMAVSRMSQLLRSGTLTATTLAHMRKLFTTVARENALTISTAQLCRLRTITRASRDKARETAHQMVLVLLCINRAFPDW